MTFAPASFRAMDSRGHWCTVTVTPTPAEGWSVTWTMPGASRPVEVAEHTRSVRDRLRAALITSGLGERIPSAHVHVEGGSYFAGFDAGVLMAMVAPDRLHDGIVGEVGLDGRFRPTTRRLDELNVPVEDLAELAPPRVDAIARGAVTVP